ncbi:hypothetical protein D3C81_1869230 [compost metagenome]
MSNPHLIAHQSWPIQISFHRAGVARLTIDWRLGGSQQPLPRLLWNTFPAFREHLFYQVGSRQLVVHSLSVQQSVIACRD